MLQIDIVQRGRNATTFWSVKLKQLFWENKTSYQIFRIIVRAGRIGLMKAGGGDYLQPNFNEPICSHLNDAERNKKINEKWIKINEPQLACSKEEPPWLFKSERYPNIDNIYSSRIS